MDNGKRFSSSSGSSDKPQTTLPSKKPPPSGKKSSYNRVRVQDLLNEEDSSLSRSTPNTGGFSRDKGTVPSSNGQRILQDYECESPQCGRIFVSKGSLSAHKRTCRPAPTPFVCTQCNTSFSSNANLNKHVSPSHQVKLHPFFRCASFQSTSGKFNCLGFWVHSSMFSVEATDSHCS